MAAAEPRLPRTIAGIAVWQPLRGPFERWPQLTDLLIAVLALVLTLTMWVRTAEAGAFSLNTALGVAAYLCAFIGSSALLWRRTHPLHVHGVVLATSLVVLLLPTPNGIVAMAFSLYSLGRYEADDRASLIGAVAALALVVLDLGWDPLPDAGGIIAAGMVMALWYVGRRLRFRGEYLRLLEERARHLERERSAEAERAVAAERTRIARELHDVVAHQVSLMTVQAGAARTVVGADPEAAGEAMAAVESAGRDALAEMRHLLDVLRPAQADDALAPQPGVGDLPALVARVRDVGPDVRLETSGLATALPSRVGLQVYRIVQEALTNVIKHAGDDVRVDVRVSTERDGVSVSITDDGHGRASTTGGGHGLVGMRERVELLGGSLHAGARANGGFEVRAFLPLAPDGDA